MGFAAGFAAGANAVAIGQRTRMAAQEAEDRKREQALRERMLDLQTREAEQRFGDAQKARDDKDAVAAAFKPETVEFDGPATPAQIAAAQNEGAPSPDAFKVTGQVVLPVGEQYRKASTIARQRGMLDQADRLDQQYRTLVKEGGKDALDTLLTTGDANKAKEVFNQTGSMKIDGDLIAEPVDIDIGEGQKRQDYRLSVRNPDGTVRQLGSAVMMRYRMDGIDKEVGFQQALAEGKRKDRQEARADRGEARADRVADAGIDNQQQGLALRKEELAHRQRMDGAALSLQQAAHGLAQARFRAEHGAGRENPYARKLRELEQAKGKPLTEQERLGVLGLAGKEDGSTVKFVDEVIKKGIDAGTITMEDVPEQRARLNAQINAASGNLQLAQRIRQDVAAGTFTPDKRAEAEKRFGITPDWYAANGIQLPKDTPRQTVANPLAPAQAAQQPATRPAPRPAAQMAAEPSQMPAFRTAIETLRQQRQVLAQAANRPGVTPAQVKEMTDRMQALNAQENQIRAQVKRQTGLDL